MSPGQLLELCFSHSSDFLAMGCAFKEIVREHVGVQPVLYGRLGAVISGCCGL